MTIELVSLLTLGVWLSLTFSTMPFVWVAQRGLSRSIFRVVLGMSLLSLLQAFFMWGVFAESPNLALTTKGWISFYFARVALLSEGLLAGWMLWRLIAHDRSTP